MNYRCILCDLDETLLDSHKRIPKKNLEAIRKARKQNVKFVCATGRHYTGITHILKELDLYDQEDEYVLSLNGALLVECKDFKIIDSTTFKGSLAAKIIQFALDHELCASVYTPSQIYIYQLNDEERRRVHQAGLAFIEVFDGRYDYLEKEDVLKISLESNDYPYLLSLQDEIKELLNDEITYTYSSNRYMEFNSSKATKGIGLLKLAHHLKMEPSQMIAVGDHLNDISMLEAAGLSVAVNNAQDEVKAICDVVTKANHNEGAIYEIVEKYILGGNNDE
ncbi:MAG: Cof-type HAD-IIB family hydrolase [Traorella sp.]